MKIVYSWKLLTIFAKCSILDVWHGSKYASDHEELSYKLKKNKLVSNSSFQTIWKKNTHN